MSGASIKLSIIIPVYNVEKYLDQCLQSSISQSYDDIEIVIVDDGSTDSSGEICKRYKKADSRIHYVYQENGGLSKARNTGLLNASGEYVLFADSDDWLNNKTCEYCVDIIHKYNPDVIVFGFAKAFDDKEEIITVSGLETGYISQDEAMTLLGDDSFGNYAWNKCYKKSLFDNIKYPVGKLLEDIGTTCHVFHKASKFYYLKEVLYYYRQRQDSIMHIQSHKRVHDEFEQRYNQMVFFQNEYKNAMRLSGAALFKSALKYLLWFEMSPECDKCYWRRADLILKSYKEKTSDLGLSVNLCRMAYLHFPFVFKLMSKIINRKR